MNKFFNYLSKICFFSFLFFTLNAQAQYTKEINSNRPSFSMGAYSVSKSVFQIETGLGYQEDYYNKNNNSNSKLIDLQVRYGAFFEQLEFVADFKFDNSKVFTANEKESFSGFRQVSIGGKYLIYDSYKNYVEKRNVYSWKANQRYKWRRLVPAVSLYVAADFKGNDHYFPKNIPSTTLKGMIITQQHINNKLSFVTNLIIENATNDDFRSYGYIATLSYGFNKRWSAFAENQGYFRKYEGVEQDFKKDCIFRGGFAFLVNKNFQLDLGAGTNITNEPSRFAAQIGFSWRTHKIYKQTNEEPPL